VKPSDRSWLSLLGFFSVITLGSSLIFAVVFAGVTAAIAGSESAQAAEDQQVDPLVPGRTFSGIITDAKCGSRHTDSKTSASECVRKCVRSGSRYVMVDGDKIYDLVGAPDQFSKFAGQRISVTGVLSGGAISVSPADLQAAKVGP